MAVTVNNQTFTVANVNYSGSVGDLYVFNSSSSSPSFITGGTLPGAGSAVGYVIGGGGNGSGGGGRTGGGTIGGGGGGGGGVVFYDFSNLATNTAYTISVGGSGSSTKILTAGEEVFIGGGGGNGGAINSASGGNGGNADSASVYGSGGGGGGATDTSNGDGTAGGEGGSGEGGSGEAGSNSVGAGIGGDGGNGFNDRDFPFSKDGSWEDVLTGAFGKSGTGGIGGTGDDPGTPGSSVEGYGCGGGGDFDGSGIAGKSGAVLIWVAYPPPPTDITNVQASLDSSSNVILSWSGGTGSGVTTSVEATANGGATVTINSETNPQTISGLTPGKNYQIVITATNGISPDATNSIVLTTMASGAIVTGYTATFSSTDASGSPGRLFQFNTTGSFMFSNIVNSGEAYVWAAGGGGNGGGGLDGLVGGGGGSGGNYVAMRNLSSLAVVGRKYYVGVGEASEMTTIEDSSGNYLVNAIGGSSGTSGILTDPEVPTYQRGLGGVATNGGSNSTAGSNGGNGVGTIFSLLATDGSDGFSFTFDMDGNPQICVFGAGGGGGGDVESGRNGGGGGNNPGSGGGLDAEQNEINPSGGAVAGFGGNSGAGNGGFGGGGGAGFGGGGGGGDVNSGGGGAGSRGVVLLWLAAPAAATAPTPITDIQVALDSSSNVIVSWSGGTGDGVTTTITALPVTGDTISFPDVTSPATISGLTPGITYIINITATNGTSPDANADINLETLANGTLIAGYGGALGGTYSSIEGKFFFFTNAGQNGSILFSNTVTSNSVRVWAAGGGGDGGNGSTNVVGGGGGSGGNYMIAYDLSSSSPVTGTKYNITLGNPGASTTIQDSSGSYLVNVLGGTNGGNGIVGAGTSTPGDGGIATAGANGTTAGASGGAGGSVDDQSLTIAGSPGSNGTSVSISLNSGSFSYVFSAGGGGGGGFSYGAGLPYLGGDGGSNAGSGGGVVDTSGNLIPPEGGDLASLGGDSAPGGGNYGGGGGAGFGGGGGGGDISSGGGKGSAGAVIIWIKTAAAPPVPSQPGATSLDATTITFNSITAIGNPTGIENSPTSATFYLYDSSGSIALAEGNGTLDASGNYYYTFTSVDASGTPLSPDTLYDITWLLSNADGDGLESDPIPFTTAATPLPSKPNYLKTLSHTKTYYSVTIKGTPIEVTGEPFTSATFKINNASSQVVFPDSSGNYSHEFTSLDPNELYLFTWFLTNSYGDGTESDPYSVTTDMQPLPSPQPGALSLSATYNSISAIGNHYGVSNIGPAYQPVTARFYLFEQVGTPLSISPARTADASGNYYHTFTTTELTNFQPLDPSITYKVEWVLRNTLQGGIDGIGEPSQAQYITTPDPPVPSPPVSGSLTGTSTDDSITLSGNPTGVSNIIGYGTIYAVFVLVDRISGDAVDNSPNIPESERDPSGNYIYSFNSTTMASAYQQLQPSKNYTARWSLINDLGGGQQSPDYYISTTALRVPSAPANGSLTATATFNKITVTGNSAGIDYINTPFTSIQASFSIYRGGSPPEILVDYSKDGSGNYSVEFPNLDPNEEYEFSWRMDNNKGPGSESSPLFPFSTLPLPPGQPDDDTLTATKTSNSITLTGNSTTVVTDVPFTQAIFRRYDSSGTRLETLTTSTADASGNYLRIFNSLSASTTYYFTWALINAGGEGNENITPLAVTTDAPSATSPSKPGATSLDATTTTYYSIIARGDASGIENSPTSATFYLYNSAESTVLAQGTVSPDASGNYSFTFTSIDASGTRLLPETYYDIAWLLSNGDGSGIKSDSIAFQTAVLPIPSQPGDENSILTSTYNSITAIVIKTNIDNIGPAYAPVRARFYLYDYSLIGDINVNNSGEVTADSSGNYSHIFTQFSGGQPLQESTQYTIQWQFINTLQGGISGEGMLSPDKAISTTAAPLPPGQPDDNTLTATKTSNTVTLTGNPTNVSGYPFSHAIFRRYDSSGTPVGSPVTTNTVDGSGNYVATFSTLSASTTYYFKWALTNTVGTGQFSFTPLAVTTDAPPAIPPSTPANGSLTATATHNTITVIGNPTGVTNSPTSANFKLYDSSGSPLLTSPADNTLDASGNYSYTFTSDASGTSLSSSTLYTLSWYLSNGSGAGSESSLISRSTLAPPPAAITNVQASLDSSSNIIVSWQGGTGTGVTTTVVATAAGEQTVTINSATSPRAISGLTPGKSYTITITAANGTSPNATASIQLETLLNGTLIAGYDLIYSSTDASGNPGTQFQFTNPGQNGSILFANAVASNSVRVWAVGGGGNGGSRAVSGEVGGGGGSGGNYFLNYDITSSTTPVLGTKYNITVGNPNSSTTIASSGGSNLITAASGVNGGNGAVNYALNTYTPGIGGIATGSGAAGPAANGYGGSGGSGGDGLAPYAAGAGSNGIQFTLNLIGSTTPYVFSAGGGGSSDSATTYAGGDGGNNPNSGGGLGTGDIPFPASGGDLANLGGNSQGGAGNGGGGGGAGFGGGGGAGNGGGLGSAGAVFIWIADAVPQPPGKPSPPSLVSRTSTSITVSGDPSTSSNGPFTRAFFTIGDASGNFISESYDNSGNPLYDTTFNNLTPSTTYKITWIIENSVNESDRSDFLIVTTAAAPPPTAITNVEAISVTSSSMTVSWSGGSGTDVTTTIVATADGGQTVTINSATSPQAISGLTAGKTYTILITAANGTSPNATGSINQATLNDPPTGINNMQTSLDSSSNLILSWSGGTGTGVSATITAEANGVSTITINSASNPQVIRGIRGGKEYTIRLTVTNGTLPNATGSIPVTAMANGAIISGYDNASYSTLDASGNAWKLFIFGNTYSNSSFTFSKSVNSGEAYVWAVGRGGNGETNGGGGGSGGNYVAGRDISSLNPIIRTKYYVAIGNSPSATIRDSNGLYLVNAIGGNNASGGTGGLASDGGSESTRGGNGGNVTNGIIPGSNGSDGFSFSFKLDDGNTLPLAIGAGGGGAGGGSLGGGDGGNNPGSGGRLDTSGNIILPSGGYVAGLGGYAAAGGAGASWGNNGTPNGGGGGAGFGGGGGGSADGGGGIGSPGAVFIWLNDVGNAPTAITNVQTSSVTSSSLSVSWSGGTGDWITTTIVASASGEQNVTINPASNPQTISGLTTGKTYTFLITASNGISPDATGSINQLITGGAPPTAITNIQASSVTSSSMTVSWSGGSGTDVTTTIVATADGGQTVTINPATSPQAISGLTAGKTYTILITAANGTSPNATGSINQATLAAPQGPTKPSPPVLVSRTSTSITVSGDPATSSNGPFNSAYFQLYDANEGFIRIEAGTLSNTLYIITFSGLTPSTDYKIRWGLTNNADDGPASDFASFETLAAPQPPGTPSAPTFVSKTSNSIIVLGNPDTSSNPPFTSATFYLNNGGTPISITGEPVDGGYSGTFTGLTPNTTYEITWILTNDGGNSSESPILDVTTDASASLPNQPDGLTLVSATTTTIQVTGNIGSSPTGNPYIGATFKLVTQGGTPISGQSFNVSGDNTTFSYTFTGLTPGTTYYIAWLLRNTAGSGPLSSIFQASTSSSSTDGKFTVSGYTTKIAINSFTPLSANTFMRMAFSNLLTTNLTGNLYHFTPSNANGSISWTGSLAAESAYIFMVGGGGGGASDGTSSTGAGGGGGGQYFSADLATITAVTITSPLTFIVGSAGAADTDGTSSDLSNGSDVISVSGGSKGNGLTGGAGGSAIYPSGTTGQTPGGDGGAGTTGGAGGDGLAGADILTMGSNDIYFGGGGGGCGTSGGGTGGGPGGRAAGIAGILSTPSLGAGNSAQPGSDSPGSLTGGGGGGGYGGGGGGGAIGGAGADGAIFIFIARVTTNVPCFARGSKILCLNDGKEEYVPIEKIPVGMPVKTLKGQYIKVHSIGSTTFKNPDNADRGPNRLFRLTPANYPELTEDLIMTGCHSRLVVKLTPEQKSRHLKLMKSLYMTTDMFRLMAFIDEKTEPYIGPGDHEVWHLALENDNRVCNYGIYANGLLVETASIKTMTERSGLVLIE